MCLSQVPSSSNYIDEQKAGGKNTLHPQREMHDKENILGYIIACTIVGKVIFHCLS